MHSVHFYAFCLSERFSVRLDFEAQKRPENAKSPRFLGFFGVSILLMFL